MESCNPLYTVSFKDEYGTYEVSIEGNKRLDDAREMLLWKLRGEASNYWGFGKHQNASALFRLTFRWMTQNNFVHTLSVFNIFNVHKIQRLPVCT